MAAITFWSRVLFSSCFGVYCIFCDNADGAAKKNASNKSRSGFSTDAFSVNDDDSLWWDAVISF